MNTAASDVQQTGCWKESCSSLLDTLHLRAPAPLDIFVYRASASSGVVATAPSGTGTPYWRKISWPMYSCTFKNRTGACKADCEESDNCLSKYSLLILQLQLQLRMWQYVNGVLKQHRQLCPTSRVQFKERLEKNQREDESWEVNQTAVTE